MVKPHDFAILFVSTQLSQTHCGGLTNNIDLLLDDSNQRYNHALEVDGSLRETVCECRHYRAYVCEVVPIAFLKAFTKDGQRVPHTSIEAF